MRILTILFAAGVLAGCSSKTEVEEMPLDQNTTAEVKDENIEPVYPDFYFDTLVGSYEGDFGGSPIRININFASNKHATGYNIHKGLVRNISGSVTEDSNSIFLSLAEPGENKYDGVFNLTVNREDLKMSGTWTPNDENLKAKDFSLERMGKEFLKNPHTHLSDDFIREHLSYVGDTIGDFSFFEDGLVKYEYYPFKDDKDYIEQMEIIRGNWSFHDDTTILINWEKNTAFPDRNSHLKIREFQYEDYSSPYLFLDGRILYSNIN